MLLLWAEERSAGMVSPVGFGAGSRLWHPSPEKDDHGTWEVTTVTHIVFLKEEEYYFSCISLLSTGIGYQMMGAQI